MAKFINPFTDFGFKLIFGTEKSKPLLISFLNSLFCSEDGYSPIVDVTYTNKELPGPSVENRTAIYDIFCTTDSGKQFIVEMQNNTQTFFINRALFYVSKSIVEQSKKGKDWDFKLAPVYMVSFLNFEMKCLGDNIRSDAMIIDIDTHEPITDKVRFIHIQLDKFNITEKSACKTVFDKWLFNLLNMQNMEYMPFSDEDEVFKVLESQAEYGALSYEDRLAYDRSLKAYRDYNNTIAYARKEGREEGREEMKLDVARKMKAQGFKPEAIASFVDLPIEKIEQL